MGALPQVCVLIVKTLQRWAEKLRCFTIVHGRKDEHSGNTAELTEVSKPSNNKSVDSR